MLYFVLAVIRVSEESQINKSIFSLTKLSVFVQLRDSAYFVARSA